MTADLVDRVRGLLDRTVSHPVAEAADAVAAARQRLDEPLRVAIAGKVKAGKSTLLNALVGEELAPTDAGECTRIVTWYRNSHTARLTAVGEGGRRELPFRRDGGAIAPDLGWAGPADVEHLEVEWPSQRLREMTLIDTPGIESLSTDVSARTHRFLVADDDAPTATDAVLYLMRHMHGSDLRFLETFHDDGLAHATPLNAVAVLSRADEVGVCRLGAMASADRIAARYRRDPQLRRLCQTVVPVAGLLAQAACTLTEHDTARLKQLAAAPVADVDHRLATADRFLDPDVDAGGLVGVDRDELMDRLGLFGLRLAVALLRVSGDTTTSQLSAELGRRSGIEPLRATLLRQFAGRSDLLKARSAMASLEAVLVRHPHPDDHALAGDLERLTAETHAFTELRVLHALWQGAIPLPDADLAPLGRLLGADGYGDHERLGLPAEAPEADVLAVATDTLTRWRRRSENPLSTKVAADAARVAAHTCERIVATRAPNPVPPA